MQGSARLGGGVSAPAQRENRIVGDSDVLNRVRLRIDQVAPTDTTVLILGETGTGKELVAREIHARSARNGRPLVTVNCSALPAGLIESELFGHERGAFTGAYARQLGRFEAADGGTIFLDEIGDLPLDLQTKLLRVLEERELERLGSSKTIKVDARAIAATNRNLAEAIQQGTFRSDLYYRLNVYPLHLPPLRQRREDIPALARTFLIDAGLRLGRRFQDIPPAVLEALRSYDWPGNVRELQNVIQRAAVTSMDSTVELPEGWSATWDNAPSFSTTRAGDGRDAFNETAPGNVSLSETMRGYILHVLEQTHWRIEGPKGAALLLGLHASTLRSRMRKLGILESGAAGSARPRHSQTTSSAV
jgi:transcriptional regulator with GAF, ATPase, and Fis domain